jgi:hypothetical protein
MIFFFIFDCILHYVFVLYQCIVARIRPSVLDRYDMYAGDESDAGVCSGRLVRLSWSYVFRFFVSIWNVFEVAVRDSDVC